MRRKVRFCFTIMLFISFCFITYQVIMFIELSNELKHKVKSNLIRGTHEKQLQFYRAIKENSFKCIESSEEIDFSKLNDDYCDCQDGSDEPGTNACENGRFFCDNQIVSKNFPNSIGSLKVNDGICDCCDGSDEWKNSQLLKKFDKQSQIKANCYHPPCPNMC